MLVMNVTSLSLISGYLTSAAASVRTQEINTGSRFMIDDNLYESGDVESHCSTVHRAGHPGQYSGPCQPVSATMIFLWLRFIREF